jgi:hypothetical protein
MISQKHKVGAIKGDNIPVTKTTAVGDIAPQEGITKAEKRRLEEVYMSIIVVIGHSQALQEAMHNFVHDMLHFSPAAQRIYALWKVCLVAPFRATVDITRRFRNMKKAKLPRQSS